MRIGVDASCWTNRRGYGRYTRELLRTLLKVDTRNEYRLFISATAAREAGDLPEAVTSQWVLVETSDDPTRAASASGYRSPRDLLTMGRAVRRWGSDLDLFFFPSVYTYFPLLGNVRTIVTIHDTIAERYPALIFPSWRARLFWRLKVRCAIWQSDVIATVSETAKRDLVAYFGLPDATIRIIPDAVSEVFHPIDDATGSRQVLARYGVDANQRIILYVGGISPHKNLITLIDAYALVTRGGKLTDSILTLVGDVQKDGFYSSYSAVRSRVEELGIADRVVFTGFVPDEDLVHFYNVAEFLVLPSFGEGFGLPALEAMACGTPVVASRVGALPLVVGDAGCFFDPHAPEELAAWLRQLLEDTSLREQLAQNALRRARQFTWDQSARAALATFEDVARGRYRQ